MKRHRIELTELAALPNLQRALWKAARGKRARPDVVDFLARPDARLARLTDNILAGRVPYGAYRAFTIHDPKTRLIHAACFDDRVLHHAIMNLAEPVFERSLVPSTYACRPGKGVHRAIAQVQRPLRRFPWYCKVDVAGYFPAIDHRRLFALLARRFKGEDFLALLWRIVDSYHSVPGKGLPIGSLTSQHFANHYLDGADRLLLADGRVRAHVRYMDDIVFWCDERVQAAAVLAELGDYLARERELRLKPEPEINRSGHGVTWCGYRIHPGTIRLTPRKRQRYRLLLDTWESQWLEGAVDEAQLQRAYASVHGPTLHADALAWRREHFRRHPSAYSAL